MNLSIKAKCKHCLTHLFSVKINDHMLRCVRPGELSVIHFADLFILGIPTDDKFSTVLGTFQTERERLHESAIRARRR